MLSTLLNGVPSMEGQWEDSGRAATKLPPVGYHHLPVFKLGDNSQF